MNFQETIMAMNAGLAGCDGNGQPGKRSPKEAQSYAGRRARSIR